VNREDDLIVKQLDKMDMKLSNVQEEIGEIKVIISINAKDIAEHIRRTNLLEIKIDDEKKFRDKLQQESQDRMGDLELPGKSFGLLLKVVGAISLVASLIFTITKLI
jgi:hypothetical protein